MPITPKPQCVIVGGEEFEVSLRAADPGLRSGKMHVFVDGQKRRFLLYPGQMLATEHTVYTCYGVGIVIVQPGWGAASDCGKTLTVDVDGVASGEVLIHGALTP